MPLGIVRVGSNERNPSHDIELWDGIRAIGLKLDGGPRGVQEIPQTPSTLKFSGGGTKFGDWEPGMSHIQQSDWSGGRGQEQFSEDDTRYFDSQSAWTLTPNKLFQMGLWVNTVGGTGSASATGWTGGALTPRGLVSSTGTQTGVVWITLIGSTRYHSTYIGGGVTSVADYEMMWIRRVGSPGTLTFEIRPDDGAGKPSATVTATVTKTISDVTDFVSVFLRFDWTGTIDLSSDVFHVVIYGASADNFANHWEVGTHGGEASGGLALTASGSNGSTWTLGTSTGIGRAFNAQSDADIDRKWIFFEMDGALYAVSNRADGTAPTLLINGGRGKATAGSTTTLTNTNATFETAIVEQTQASVKIVKGTGVGQVRRIASATSTVLTVSPAFAIAPDSSSEYVILGSLYWYILTGHGLTKPVTSVCVVYGIAYMAQGGATDMRRMRFNAGAAPPAHEFAADTGNKAELLYTWYDRNNPNDMCRVVRALNTVGSAGVYKASAKAWGTTLTFGSNLLNLTSQSTVPYLITGIQDYDGELYIAREDSLWKIVNDTPQRIEIGLESMPDPNNGRAIKSLGLFLFFSYMQSIERLYGKTLDDLAPFKSSGLAGRTGNIVSMASAYNWLFFAIDGGASGTSSVWCYDGRGFHEVFRGWAAGVRIQAIYWQAVPDAFPRLWVSVGGKIVYVRFPQDSLNPLNDSNMDYQHEAVLIGSTIDMDAFSLPKFIKELTLITENLSAGTEVRVDYQSDSNIGTSTWTHLGTFFQSPIDTVSAGFGNIRQIRFRLRLITDSFRTPTIVKALVVEGYARTPLKYQYNMRVVTSSFLTNYLGARDADPDELTQFLKNAARGARKIIMRSVYKSLDNIVVIVEPPSIMREFLNRTLGFWGGKITITVREA